MTRGRSVLYKSLSGPNSIQWQQVKRRGKMQSVARITIPIFLMATVVASATNSGTKLRRDGVLNLYPFPRVGRSHQTWQIPIHDLLDEDIDKRQLYAFPRVGRSHPIQITPAKLEELLFGSRNRGFVKRESESTDSTGMWFGPRLGRGFRSEDDDISNEDRSEPEQIQPDNSDREKRDTKRT